MRRRGKLTENDVEIALREVAWHCLKADVNYGVVRSFTNRVKEVRFVPKFPKALNPAQTKWSKLFNEELIATLGQAEPLNCEVKATCADDDRFAKALVKNDRHRKLAKTSPREGERVMMVAADFTGRQLLNNCRTLGERIDVPCVYLDGAQPVKIVKRSLCSSQTWWYTLITD